MYLQSVTHVVAFCFTKYIRIGNHICVHLSSQLSIIAGMSRLAFFKGVGNLTGS